MAAPYLDAPVSFDGMTTAELMSSHPAISYPSPVPYQPSVFSSHIPRIPLTLDRQDMSYHSPTIGQAARSPYASSYEDGFPEMQNSSRSSPEAPSIERGNKLLSFQPSTSSHAVLDYSMRQSSLQVGAQLHGMFFLAESSRTLTGELASSPAELTCYRRNLFQITGNVTLPRMMQYVINEQGERMPIVSQELTISATESVEGSPVKIISVPWKTPATGTAPPPEEKVEKEPTSIPLDQSQNHDVDAEYSVFPIAWKRLQFRVATANNGRRRELQQHFTIKLSVTATLSDGSKISLCDAFSGPIIVRGRSPRNFQQRKDVPLSGSGVSMRKSMSVSPSMRRSSTLDSIHRSTPKLEPTGDAYSLSPSDALRRGSPTPNGFDWPHPITSAPVSPYHQSLPDLSRSGSLKRKADDAGLAQLAVPAYDNSGRSSAPPDERPRKMVRSRGATISGMPSNGYMPNSTTTSASGPTSGSVPATTFTYSQSLPAPQYFNGGYSKEAQAENTQLLHEYYPMGMEEWSHSDSIYRPHVTHLPQVASVGGAPMGGRAYYPDDLAA
ncbi:MAG: hypothetical protein MMC23_000004 [Stictis urceolatum]|nr:hypothetical protein [Stictis urceolata]